MDAAPTTKADPKTKPRRGDPAVAAIAAAVVFVPVFLFVAQVVGVGVGMAGIGWRFPETRIYVIAAVVAAVPAVPVWGLLYRFGPTVETARPERPTGRGRTTGRRGG